MIDFDLLAFPFAAGLVAAFNPCGFAMLPTYLTYFLGLDNDDRSLARSVIRGGKVGLALTLGFVLVFGIFGVLFEVILSAGARSAVQSSLWVVTVVSGIGIAILGVAMLRGFQPVLNLPKLQMGTGSRELSSMFLFGVSYGVVSLGCTIGPFLVAVSGSVASTDSQFGAIFTFIAYALGMGSVIVFLTMALAAGRSGIANRMRSMLPLVNKVSGGLLVLAGAYLVSYGIFERDPLNNSNPAIEVFEDAQAWLINFVNDLGAKTIGLVLLGASVAIVGAALAFRSRNGDDQGDIVLDDDTVLESPVPENA